MPMYGEMQTNASTRPPQPATTMQQEAGAYIHEAAEYGQQKANELARGAKQHPYATLALAAGFALALGALWKLGARRPASHLDQLYARLPESPDLSWIKGLDRYWR